VRIESSKVTVGPPVIEREFIAGRSTQNAS
jgi:hypothetical protein